ncbi:PAS domain S-box protein [Nonomuraea gerenzanensis]|uniref:Sensory box histidine kinase n=1 Tax=Nonomuraea gerenzanensis TaxID=93944 RepID=A0A1M4DXP9_9ACTN|nr:PAS domain S-box protein [Nonomuraea gerenzanensis]UBU13637.1 PAS domain S-box protein [Nonomuraea gerenzanensis]SBO91304.1 Sensory box histidine kinase [Nonomuraea gerenzanensis]
MSNGNLARVLHRIGRRGASLAFVGLLCLAIAASLAFPPAEQRAAPNYVALAAVAPLHLWALAWCGTGLLCLVQMFLRSDRIAFAVATALLLLYGLVYLISTFTGDNPRGWVGAAVWLAFGGWIALIATWPEAATADRVTGGAAVIVADANGLIQSWNPQAAKLFGWSIDEAVGRPLTILMPPRLRDQHTEGLAKVRATGVSALAGRIIPLVGLRRDGSEFPIALTVNAWHSDDGIAYTGVIRPMRGGDAD